MDATGQIAKAIREVRGLVPAIVTATVATTTAAGQKVAVVLDNDPTSTNAVSAINLLGYAVQGQRVVCLKYPPRGLVVLGSLDGQDQIDMLAERLRLSATNDVSLASTLHALQIGPDTGVNLRMDVNEIMVANNGAEAILDLNADGGTVRVGANLGTNGIACLGMRHAGAYEAGPSAAITGVGSTTYAALSPSLSLVIPRPPSNSLTVFVGGRIGLTGSATTDAGVLAFEIRENSSAGALLVDPAGDANGAVQTWGAGGSLTSANRPFLGRQTTITGLSTSATALYIRVMGRVAQTTTSMVVAQYNLSVIPSM